MLLLRQPNMVPAMVTTINRSMHSFVKLITILTGCLLTANALFAFNRQDSLRGGNGRGRDWWDVQQYRLEFSIDTANKVIAGNTTIQFRVMKALQDSMQIDLQQPMELDAVFRSRDGALYTDKRDKRNTIEFSREGNVYWLKTGKENWPEGSTQMLQLSFHGKPREAVKPPWDGGFIWTKDSLGHSWVSVACQGLGASSWWPCKDYQGDEPDSGMFIRQDGHLNFVSNGTRVTIDTIVLEDPVTGWQGLRIDTSWRIRNPVNTYNATFYAGNYTSWSDTLNGLKGTLKLGFYPLLYHKDRAIEQFKQVKQMLRAFEYWFGPYPFYEDGYKIVEAPFLGMEHQGAIAYGNKYQMGYQGKDRSGTGVGLLFDFIIVHESGHEWFGNSITAADIADNWIHEGFTTYSETLFAEYWFGREKAFGYSRGEWKNISNDRNVIGKYGVNDAGSSDKYDKGSALVHTIRLLMNNDEKFRAMLHKMNDTFYHKQITTKQMEDFIIGFSGLQLEPVFNQYLRSTMLPELQWSRKGKQLEYRFAATVPAFTLPVPMVVNGKPRTLHATAEWQTMRLPSRSARITFPAEFLIRLSNPD
jgi:aminopeptidase N